MPALAWLRLAADSGTIPTPTPRAYHAAGDVKARQMDAQPQTFAQNVYYLRQKKPEASGPALPFEKLLVGEKLHPKLLTMEAF